MLSIQIMINHLLSYQAQHALFIDTEGGFSSKEILASNNLTFDQTTVKSSTKSNNNSAFNSNSDILQRIHYSRVLDHNQQCQTLLNLESFIQSNSKVQQPIHYQKIKFKMKIKLIIIDSISFHFRFGFTDPNKRTKLFTQLTFILNKLVQKYRILV